MQKYLFMEVRISNRCWSAKKIKVALKETFKFYYIAKAVITQK